MYYQYLVSTAFFAIVESLLTVWVGKNRDLHRITVPYAKLLLGVPEEQEDEMMVS